MLILGRTPGQKIVIKLEDGRKLFIIMRDISGNQAKIGIEAPKTINIVREELLYREDVNGHGEL